MADQFELFHLSLLARAQKDWIEFDPDKISREVWLRKVFNEEQKFEHYGTAFHYVCSNKDADDGSIIGRVGRHIVREENKPPSEGLEDFSHETWLAAMLVLDPTHHEDGQKMALQDVQLVGTPKSLVKSLIAAINQRYSRGPYVISAAQIIEEQTFWQFVENNKGLVTDVTLELIAPNMFGSQDEFDRDMQDWRDSEKAAKLKMTVSNHDGMEPDTPKMRNAVHYASKGGGKITAKAKNKKRYSSDNAVKRSFLDDVKETGAELIEAARKLTNRILGRE